MSEQADEAQEAQEAQAGGAAENDAGRIVLVDPDAASRTAGEDLEEDLECIVVAIDSSDFTPAESEDILEAEAIVLVWDLEVRLAIDLLEAIRHDPQLADKIVLLASDHPTRTLVKWATRLGADGLVRLPWDGSSLRAALDAARARRADRELEATG